jgi:hypothetical protein
MKLHLYRMSTGRAIAQAVGRRLPTAEAHVRSKNRSCGICGGQRSSGVGFLGVLQSPLSILIPPTAPYSLLNLSSKLYILITDNKLNKLT